MPKQHHIFGRPIRLSPRRISFLLVSVGLFALFTLFITLPNSIPQGPSLSKTLADHKITIPTIHNPFSSSILNPFRPASHAPPVQKNSTYAGSSWYSNWNWRSPFSSSVTLDENRSLLPPLKERPPIYCYYDTTVQKEKATKEAESDLLLTWRRAWWAQGFRPVILSAPEAMNNPLYNELQLMDLEPTLKAELMRWLAWENMGGGLLADRLIFPMASRDDALLSYLRRGEYPKLTRLEGFDNGMFAGPKADITAAVTMAMRHPVKKGAKDLVSAVEKDAIDLMPKDPVSDGLAFYSPKNIELMYGKVNEQYNANHATGLQSLNYLINAHLHDAWRNTFHKGIAVLKPLPKHSTTMVEPALDLATWLSQCPDTPMPSTCPPNLPKCSPCVSSSPMKVATPARYRNTTGLYTIGTVPHPFTLAALTAQRTDIDIPWVRRKMERDLWLSELTKEHMGTGVSANYRIVTFKEAVAGDWATAHSIWLTAERETLPRDLDWYFGFAIPVNGTDDGKSETPVPGPERRPKPEVNPADGPVATPEDLAKEPELMTRAREIGKSKEEQDITIRNAVEAWNLADTEAWKFARAFLARSRVERLKWEEDEKGFAGGAGSDKEDKRSSWSRWSK